jgi:hypothetical protein
MDTKDWVAMREVFTNDVVMGTTLTRTSGFNGDGLIEIMDTPPAMGSGGNVQMFRVGPGMSNMSGQSTPSRPPSNESRRFWQPAGVRALRLGMLASSYSPVSARVRQRRTGAVARGPWT